ncbi:hypothetical protein B0T11DRAFT_291452 [Plectosphaerella cucumerina]|uniref:DUF7702 domain-containing protein n=1 Tax=Plectosphaerella cucumerina TaxID=40658 RepID=A0A8K0WYD3_9PEZI|nr:hypothetical protein B0T11DRAFT_291452 [Plectosphaerella cucumerina]
MLGPHTSVAIAQIVFYVPIVPITLFILIRNWNNRPRMAWYPLFTFSLVRLAGGIISVVRENKPTDIGLIIATTVLLNVGVIPLLVSMIGITRVILRSSLDTNSRAFMFLKVIRYAFLIAIILLVASGSLSSNLSNLHVARALAQAAYVVLAVVLVMATLELIHLLGQKERIAPAGYFYIKYCLLATPMLAIRMAAGLLYEFTINKHASIWNPLSGSAVAFALMTLVTEYIVLGIFIYLGFHRIKHRNEDTEEELKASEERPADMTAV